MSEIGKAWINSSVNEDGSPRIETYCGRCDDTDPNCRGCKELAMDYIELLNAVAESIDPRAKNLFRIASDNQLDTQISENANSPSPSLEKVESDE